MNTQTTVITEADVASFLRETAIARKLQKDVFLAVSLTPSRKINFAIYGHVFPDGKYVWINAEGETLDAAFSDWENKQPTTAKLVAQKRAEAEKLLAEALAIESGVAA